LGLLAGVECPSQPDDLFVLFFSHNENIKHLLIDSGAPTPKALSLSNYKNLQTE
jgi:hypothetical protein